MTWQIMIFNCILVKVQKQANIDLSDSKNFQCSDDMRMLALLRKLHLKVRNRFARTPKRTDDESSMRNHRRWPANETFHSTRWNTKSITAGRYEIWLTIRKQSQQKTQTLLFCWKSWQLIQWQGYLFLQAQSIPTSTKSADSKVLKQ